MTGEHLSPGDTATAIQALLGLPEKRFGYSREKSSMQISLVCSSDFCQTVGRQIASWGNLKMIGPESPVLRVIRPLDLTFSDFALLDMQSGLEHFTESPGRM